MKLELELELSDVYGGDGQRRIEAVEQVKLSRTKSRTRTRSDIGVPIASQMQEENTETVQKSIDTFRKDDHDCPILRLGGIHGKFWGALKDAAEQLYAIGEPAFASLASAKRILGTIYVSPVWVRLESATGQRVDTLPQIMAGRQGSMVEMRYDVIGSAKARITVEFPDQVKAQVGKLLDRVQRMGTLNKRRATIRIKGGFEP